MSIGERDEAVLAYLRAEYDGTAVQPLAGLSLSEYREVRIRLAAQGRIALTTGGRWVPVEVLAVDDIPTNTTEPSTS